MFNYAKMWLEKIMLASSIALGDTLPASIPFGAKIFLDDKQDNTTIQKPGDGSLDGENGTSEKKIEITKQQTSVEFFPGETATISV